jgi:hypothetical protein|nr:MAG TPA: hypothetical protein [Caudoviricetes sp.]
MLEIQDGAILLTRGDSAVLHVAITNGATGEDYEMQESDKLIFTVRKYPYKEAAVLIEKTLTGGNIFRLKPGDTAALKYGTYKYDVELRSGDDVYTVVPCGDLVLTKEVTMA